MPTTGGSNEITISAKALDQASAVLTKLTQQMDALAAAGTRVNASMKGMAASSQAAAASTVQATTATKGFTASLHSSLSVIRGMLIRMVALAAIMGALAVSINGTIGAAMDFEDSFAGIRKTMDLSASGFDFLAKKNRELAREIPVTVNEINRIGEIAGQLGIRGINNIVKFEKEIAQIAVTTNLTADEAAIAMARIAGVMQEPINNIDRMASALVDLGNKTKTTESEIVEFALRIAGAGATVGLTTANILAIGSAFTEMGAKVERGGTATQKVLFSMQKAVAEGGDELTVFAQVLQMTEEGFKQLVRTDPMEAFIRFIDGLRAVGEDGVRVLDALGLADQRLIASFLAVAGAGGRLRRDVELSSVAWEENVAALEEFEKRMGTTSSQIQIMKNNFNDIGITLGLAMLPALKTLSGWLVRVADGIRYASEHIHFFVLAFHLALTAITFLALGPTGFIPLTLLIFQKWDQALQEAPEPVQNFVIAVAHWFDVLVDGIRTGINAAIALVEEFINKIADNKFTKTINKFLTRGGLPALPTGVDLGRADFIDTDLEGWARNQQALAKVKAAFDKMRENYENLTGSADEFLPGELPEMDIGPFLESLGDAPKGKDIDLLADGIIDLWEALEYGISLIQAVEMELGYEAEQVANRFWRASVMTEKLRRRMASSADIEQHATLALVEAQVEATQKMYELRFALRAQQQSIASTAITFRDSSLLFLQSLVDSLQGYRDATAEMNVSGTRLRDSLSIYIENLTAIAKEQTEANNTMMDMRVQTILLTRSLRVAAVRFRDVSVAWMEASVGVLGDLVSATNRLAVSRGQLRDAATFWRQAATAIIEAQADMAEEARKLQIRLVAASAAMDQAASSAFLLVVEQIVDAAEQAATMQAQLMALAIWAAQSGLAGDLDVFIGALRDLDAGFRKTEESITEFLYRLAKTALEATRARFDALFQKPTREEAEINLRLAELRRRRALLFIGGGTEDELAPLLEPIDQEIEALENLLRLRQAEADILQAQADLADQTLMTDQQLMYWSTVLTEQIKEQSAIVKSLSEQLFWEIVLRNQANKALETFTGSLTAAGMMLNAGSPRGTAMLTAGTPVSVEINLSGFMDVDEARRVIHSEVDRQLDDELRINKFGGS